MAAVYQLEVAGLRWLTERTFEIGFHRPDGFAFIPGQKIRFLAGDISRDYTLVNGPDAPFLTICVRLVDGGRFSPQLARARTGDRFTISAAFGYFRFQPSPRPAVFVATGTGIAPFVAFVRAGAGGFTLLHGVRTPGELYYRDELEAASGSYTACLSGEKDPPGNTFFSGRVTGYLESRPASGEYDFYLSGRGEMISDATLIIDRRFPGSLVFSESFF